MSKPVEILLFEFLQAACDASAAGGVLYELELHDTIYQSITRPRGIRISDAISTAAPDTGGGMKEYDAEIHIVCFAKIEGTDKKQRQAALQQVFDIETAVVGLLYGDQQLGGRVCDVVIQKTPRSYDVFDGNPYAIALIPIVINPSGHQ